MVCPRCIDTVNDIFDKLNIEIHSIKLGEVIIPEARVHSQKMGIVKQPISNMNLILY